MAFEISSVLMDRYIVRKVLGKGGMGTVYLVEHSLTGSEYFSAMKVLNPGLLKETKARNMFWKELQTWMDLPDHPNLNECRFVRTIEQQIAVFSEFVDGGSLSNWIKDGRITSIEQVLRIALQVAWGLHIAHSWGVVHQDVKPSNILLTQSGQAKLTDFGISRAVPQRTRRFTAIDGEQTLSVATGGMSVPYCSPEQMDAKVVTHRTDVWSWGLTVLEMLAGGLKWRMGAFAQDVLGQLLRGDLELKYRNIPSGLFEILKKCFMYDETERWDSMVHLSEAVGALLDEYKGNAILLPETPTPYKISTKENIRSWTPPEEFSEFIDSVSESNTSCTTESPKIQALVDLEVFDNMVQCIEKDVSTLSNKRRLRYSSLLLSKARAHEALDDLPGAISSLRMAESVLQVPDNDAYSPDKTESLVQIRLWAGIMNVKAGNHSEAESIMTDAIELLDQLMESMKEIPFNQVRLKTFLCRNLAEALLFVQKYDQAQEQIENAERLIINMTGTPEDWDSREALTDVLIVKSMVLASKGGYESALRSSDAALELYNDVSIDDLPFKIRRMLTGLYSNSALMLQVIGKMDAAGRMFDKAVEHFSHMVDFEGHYEVRISLARALMNRGNVWVLTSFPREGEGYYHRCRELLETLIYNEGRAELEADLAMVMMNLGYTSTQQKRTDLAKEFHDRAIELREGLLQPGQEIIIAPWLAMSYFYKIELLMQKGQYVEALEIADKAHLLLQRIVVDFERFELLGTLAKAHYHRASIQKHQGNLSEALEALNQSDLALWDYRNNKDHPSFIEQFIQIAILKGETLILMGQISKAKEGIGKALGIVQEQYQGKLPKSSEALMVRLESMHEQLNTKPG